MRFLHRLLLCCCCLGGSLPSLGYVRLYNDGSCSIGVYITGGSFQGTISAGSSSLVSGGWPYTYDIYPDGNPPYFRSGAINDGEQWRVNFSGCSTNGWTVSTNGPASSTNGYAFKYITFTNDGPLYADFQWGIQDSNGVFQVKSGDEVTVVRPGQGFDMWLTNWGYGGEFVWGDARDDSGMSDPERSGYGTWVSQPNGTTGSNGGPVPDPRPTYFTNVYGNVASTNSLTKGDFNNGIATLVNSLGALENTFRNSAAATNGTDMSGVISAVEENTASTATELGTIQLQLGGATNSLEEISERIGTGTNGLAGQLTGIADRIGTGTNGLAGLIGTGTNGLAGLIGTGTNGLSGKLDGLFKGFDTNLVAAMGTNATNNAIVNWTNSLVTNWITEVAGLQSYADGAVAGANESGGILGLNGPGPGSDWAVLRGVGPGGMTVFELDVKKSLSMEYLEEKISGLQAWIRIITMWGALIFAVMHYLRELRLAVWHTLTPVPLNSPTELLSLLGGLAGGPLGYVGGTAAGYLLKMGSMVAIILGLMWLPAILTVSLSTIFTGLSVNTVGDLTNAVSAPSVVGFFFNLAIPWLPAYELSIIAVNYFICRLLMDATVSILMVYVKVGTPE